MVNTSTPIRKYPDCISTIIHSSTPLN
ncbi:MAG: hypothetical protein HWN65_00615 [Candidatus Helarchaeota archaeon]|nr:hypothetical protein [Candidatus Helarchaeota archaeon]